MFLIVTAIDALSESLVRVTPSAAAGSRQLRQGADYSILFG